MENEERRGFSTKLSKSSRVAKYAEIITLCSECIGRLEDPRVEWLLASVARNLSEEISLEFAEKKDE